MKKTFSRLGMRFAIVAVLTLSAIAGILAVAPSQPAMAANPTTINFQGKVVNATTFTNQTSCTTTCSIVFRIYNTASPVTTTSCTSTATCLWEETQTSLTVTNGIFQVNLGSVCALTSASCNNTASGGIPSNWSNSSLFLTMQFNGDAAGFMSPTIKLQSVPFAFNADNLGGLNATNFVQLAQGVQNDTSTTNPSIFVNKNNGSGTPNILELQKAGGDVLVVNNSGSLLLGKAGTGGLNGTLIFNTTNASNSTITIVAASTATGYSLTLPTTGPSTSQCLQTDASVATQLKFSSCGAGGGDLQAAYAASSSPATITTTATAKGIIFKAGSTFDSTTLFQIQNASSAALVTADTTNMNVTIGGPLQVYGLLPPGAPSLSTSTSGGTLPTATTYYYMLAAYNAAGRTNAVPSSPDHVITGAGSSNKNTLSWSAVSGANGYYLYRSTDAGATYLRVDLGNVVTINDTGSSLTWTGTDHSADFVNNLTSSVAVLVGGSYYLDSAQNVSFTENLSGDVYFINSNSGRKNIFQAANTLFLNSSGITVATIDNNGTALFKNSANSTTAFQVENAAGSTLFGVNTSSGNTNNLVANSSFESAISNWSALNAGTASQSSAQAYEDDNSLLIATGTNASGGGASYTTGAGFLVNGTTYTLSAYVKTDSNLPVTTFEMGHADNGSVPTLVSCLTAQALPKNGGWQRFTCTWTSGSITGSPFIYFKQTDTVNRNLYIDDILLQTDANSQTIYRNGSISLSGSMIASPVILQNSSNSTNALQVNNAAGTQIFNVDTTDMNLIANPGFEVTLASSPGTGWTGNGSAVIVRSTLQSYTGTYSLKVTGSTTANNGAQFNLNPIVSSTGTTYTISWFAKLDAASTAMTDMAALFSADGTTTVACTPSDQVVVTTGWKRYSCSVASGATTPSTNGFIRILQTGVASGHIYYIDGVQLEAASAATPYGAGGVSLNGVINSPVVFASKANATTAFQIQNNASLSFLTADTLNNNIQIGSNTTDANAVFLTLDSYNTAADPTAPANGAMYYNTNLNVFRCRQNSVWRNCIETPNNASTSDQNIVAATANQYLTGSNVSIPQSGLQVGTQIIWRVSLNKTDTAATLANSFLIKYGTNGTNADTTVLTIAGPTQTAVADNGLLTIIVTVRSVNSSTGAIYATAELVHSGWTSPNATGLANTPSFTGNGLSAGFNNTVTSAIFGLAITTQTGCTLTVHQVQVQTVNL